jgi:hypothetical protein
MESEGTLPCSQESSTGPRLKPDDFSPYHSILSHFMMMWDVLHCELLIWVGEKLQTFCYGGESVSVFSLARSKGLRQGPRDFDFFLVINGELHNLNK